MRTKIMSSQISFNLRPLKDEYLENKMRLIVYFQTIFDWN